jgi:flagellar biosynthesis protein FlhF
MQLYTFTARSLPEALRRVRQELGPNASVLHTREVGSMLSRWLGGPFIEVTASAELLVPSRLPGESTAIAQVEEATDCHLVAMPARVPAAELDDFRTRFRSRIHAGVREEYSLVEQLSRDAVARACNHESTYAHLHRRLHLAGVSQTTATRWLQRLEMELALGRALDADEALQRLRDVIAGDLPVRGAIRIAGDRPMVVALVGCTGVGKTTSLAKLAAHSRLSRARSVAIITLDTFRIGAVEQLRTYAQIMDLPIEVAQSTADVSAAVRRLSRHELILIDTAGISAHDGSGLHKLQATLAAAQPHEIVLVQSCVSDIATARHTARAFTGAGATSLILTKLDEAPQPGRIADLLAACQLPLTYVTSGQNVPSDIQPASSAHLAKLILPDADT